MLQKIDFSKKKLGKEEYKAEYDQLVSRLAVLQAQAVAKGVGMVVLFEGWSGAGKGSRISDLLYHMDARATSVHVTEDVDVEDCQKVRKASRNVDGFHPFTQEFWEALGPRGNITFFNQGWYSKMGQNLFFNPPYDSVESFVNPEAASKARAKQEESLHQAVESFESQITADGYILKKFFLHISQETQETRLRKLAADPSTAWRVDAADLREINIYDKLYDIYDNMLEVTNFEFAPWVVLNGEDKRAVNLRVIQEIVSAFEEALAVEEDPAAAEAAAKAQANSAAGANGQAWVDERQRTPEEQEEVRRANEAIAKKQAKAAPKSSRFEICRDYPRLDDISFDKHLESEEDYRKELKALQKRLNKLEPQMYLKRIPFIIMYEGWDAAGKGGNIKRVAQALDARAYTIYPSPAPTKPELMHPFLWRYWTRLPKAGHVGIYDRSWYGRVLVERVEGFASEAEWSRAYDEINEFERDLVNWGAIVLKFWVNISPEGQLQRFEAREQDPLKSWKITGEDWRNRDKYPQYKAAVQDMFRLTSTKQAPWHVLESDDKHYARVKALKTICDCLEERLSQE
ncbi:MAG: polyphosphate--AMP phosphotransferase [Eggerthellales bacterium]|nr:polyphosphate--AMP phosphotransferase [Eggerthellales bacterium]